MSARRSFMLVVASVASAFGLPTIADAGKETYCVGGYDGTPPNVAAACNLPAIAAQHDQWHHHVFVADAAGCYDCWDENDNTCVTIFLARNPSFRSMDPYDCARAGAAEKSDRLLAHVIDGVNAIPPKPSEPPPKKLQPELERISPGPYTAGDIVRLRGVVRDDTGAIRVVAGGSFRVRTAGETIEVPGVLQPDGAVEGELKLPAAAELDVEFVPELGALAPGESLVSSGSKPVSINVEVCGFRARIKSPYDGEPLVSGPPLTFTMELFDAKTDAQVPPPAGAELEFLAVIDRAPPVSVAAGPDLTATWTPSPSSAPRTITLTARGRAGDRIVCPTQPIHVTVSEIGLGFDGSGLPRTCYVGHRCEGVLRLKRPTDARERTRLDAVLGDPTTAIVSIDSGIELSRARPAADDTHVFSRQYSELGHASWALEVHSRSATIASFRHDVELRLPLRLVLPATLDFGEAAAGTPVRELCRRLDFSRSQAAEEHRFELSIRGLEGCSAQPALAFADGYGRMQMRALDPPVEIEALDPERRWLDLCLAVSRCDAAASPPGAVLIVTPKHSDFAAQPATVAIAFRVKGRSFIGCNAWWIGPVAGVLLVAFIAAGIIRPARFPASATIQLAGSDANLRRAPAVPLREFPGSGAGFFSDAELGIHESGDVNGRTRGALVRLRAKRDGRIELIAGCLEIQSNRTLVWETVESSRGCEPVPSASYRTGGTYFRVGLG